MTRLMQLAALAGLALLCGCAAPGSGMVRVSVNGHLVDAQGAPVAGQRLELMLPKEYGLAGLDAKWGQPENYGHRNQRATVTTTAEGTFGHTFGRVTYSMLYWFIPPVGGTPRHPPEPYFFVRLPQTSNEYWSVWARQSGFDCRVAEKDSPTWLPQSPLLPATISGTLTEEKDSHGLRMYSVDMRMQFLGSMGQNTGTNTVSEDTSLRADPQH